MRYVQGWLVGVSDVGQALIPYELALTPGTGRRTHSGPVARDVFESFELAAWVTSACLARHTVASETLDAHLNFPLHGMRSSGPSCRLSFVNAFAWCLADEARHDPSETVLIGDVNLRGDVIPVAEIAPKVAFARAEGFTCIVVGPLPDPMPDTVGIATVDDLIGWPA